MAPRTPLDPARATIVTFETNCGAFSITLDAKRAPKTAASFAALVKSGFYDELTFHRVDPQLGIIQGGDPLGVGTGGPGYKVVEAPPRGLRYAVGIVAMAKTGTEVAGTSGSQFFVVTGPQAAAQLTPDYALVGRVTSGLDVVQRIGAAPADASQRPTTAIVISRATVR